MVRTIGPRSGAQVAHFEMNNRPISHRTFGPEQPTAFLTITDHLYRLHLCDDISFAALLIAQYLFRGRYTAASIVSEKALTKSESNFSGRFPILSRIQKNLGAGLRDPNNERFVHIVVQMDKSKVRDFYAVGLSRAAEKRRPRMVTWDHERWKEMYGERKYYNWLARLFWATDENDAVQALWNDVLPRKIPGQINSGIVVAHDNSSTYPPGWPCRVHRDENALVSTYRLKKGTLLSPIECSHQRGRKLTFAN